MIVVLMHYEMGVLPEQVRELIQVNVVVYRCLLRAPRGAESLESSMPEVINFA